jgi:hypothetical protein
LNTYEWAVSYNNETFEKPSNGWAGVRVDEVLALLVYQVEDNSKHFVVHCGNGVRPIFYWTVQKVVKQRFVDGELQQEPDPNERRITCFGWQKTVNGTNVKSLCRILEDGSMIFSDHDPLQVG